MAVLPPNRALVLDFLEAIGLPSDVLTRGVDFEFRAGEAPIARVNILLIGEVERNVREVLLRYNLSVTSIEVE